MPWRQEGEPTGVDQAVHGSAADGKRSTPDLVVIANSRSARSTGRMHTSAVPVACDGNTGQRFDRVHEVLPPVGRNVGVPPTAHPRGGWLMRDGLPTTRLNRTLGTNNAKVHRRCLVGRGSTVHLRP